MLKWPSKKKLKINLAGSDKADELDPKMFSTGEANCPVLFLKKLIQVLNPGEEALFLRK